MKNSPGLLKLLEKKIQQASSRVKNLNKQILNKRILFNFRLFKHHSQQKALSSANHVPQKAPDPKWFY